MQEPAATLTVAITARALFMMEDSHALFEREGIAAFADFQRRHEDDVLAPGIAFPLVRKLLALNAGATREMPLAQNPPSPSAPGICLRNSGLNSPHTVETFTPTFSNTRPRMTEITPPPPPGRSQAWRSKRPGARSACAAARQSSSIASNAAHRRSRNSSNQARAASGSPDAAALMPGPHRSRPSAEAPRPARSRPPSPY